MGTNCPAVESYWAIPARGTQPTIDATKIERMVNDQINRNMTIINIDINNINDRIDHIIAFIQGFIFR